MTDRAMAYFQGIFDALPDFAEPPTDGPFYPGDICKVRGQAMVWLAHGGWVDAAERAKQIVMVQT